jgi:hypothetical protein
MYVCRVALFIEGAGRKFANHKKEIAYQSAVDGLGCCTIEGEDAPEGLAAGLRPPLHLGARVQRSRSGLGAHHGFLLGLIGLLVAENVVLGDGVLRVPVHDLLGVRQRTLPTLRLATHSPRQRGRQPGSAAHRRNTNAAFPKLSLKRQRRKASHLGAGDSVRHHQGCHDNLLDFGVATCYLIGTGIGEGDFAVYGNRSKIGEVELNVEEDSILE